MSACSSIQRHATGERRLLGERATKTTAIDSFADFPREQTP